MAKLKVDEIEATSTDTNVKVSPKGTGIVEVKGSGGNSATLQLNCSAQSHGVKIKSPANSTGQNYTMVLPDNQIAQDKLIKVKSITGSGATAEGQLEYADIPTVDLTNLNASNLTSGTVDSARLGSFPASSGAAFELVTKTYSASAYYANIDFTGLQQNTAYRFVCRQFYTSGSDDITVYFLDSNGSPYTDYCYSYNKINSYRNMWNYGTAGQQDRINLSPWESNSAGGAGSTFYGGAGYYHFFIADFFNMYGALPNHSSISTTRPAFIGSGHEPRKFDNQMKFWCSFDMSSSYDGRQVHGIRFSTQHGSNINPDILLYKYKES